MNQVLENLVLCPFSPTKGRANFCRFSSSVLLEEEIGGAGIDNHTIILIEIKLWGEWIQHSLHFRCLWSFSMLIVGRGIKFVSEMEVNLEKLP